ncbi:ATP-dependent DNA helicase [Tessaracoccus sp. OS52]|uniref:ATP-dependent DNA helicase n=1 Tax=Tessaracoccus sp. OS52 TaxID=2886691 RepID=UPI001D11E58C|nr:ATP-dependent DNA helicase [Tessaracoccus sp. OS52]MCC2593124.1 ATP-dependent DNA helicase [Tessaracoccus sp. OS52]
MPEEVALEILQAAVSGIEGRERPGQQAMALAVAESLDSGLHLLVQAGTGTGKSLGYLAPVLARVVESDERIIIATATLALQAQLANKDIPAALAAVKKVTGKEPKTAILKGRTNYACLYRSRSGGTSAQGSLLGAEELQTSPGTDAVSKLGVEVLALREWVEEEAERGGLADRDDAPSHTAAGWQQVSIPTRECLGVAACPFGDECFVEASREEARAAQVVVTNHALLAINAMHGRTALPEHSALIVDEAHELPSRITTAATNELTPMIVERAARRALTWLEDDLATEFLECSDALRTALDESSLTRIESASAPVTYAAAQIRDVSRRVVSALSGKHDDPERTQASAAVQEVFDISARIAALADADVVWVSDSDVRGRTVWVAPLNVAGLLREQVFGETPTICTSATLVLGGDFSAFAASVGLSRRDEVAETESDPEVSPLSWRGLDVGSPFDYRTQGILYATKALPNPGRDGLTDEVLSEIAQLVWAAGGRTLGLFASRRNAEQAAAHCRRELPELKILCQGDAQLSELQREFIADPETCLFGTMSLWQGVDVPGETCQLVIIDKIPFPRPDDPLMQARKKAVDDAGGNGFMSVAATHAALLLAQGTGRLIRRSEDRGVVAILDPRLVTARYGRFLASSLPGFWATTDPDVAVNALRRLRGEE